MSGHSWIGIACVVGCQLLAFAASAQEAVAPADEKAAHRTRMQELAGSFRVLTAPGKPESKIDLVAEPVFRYADSTRQTLESALWIFGGKGRPAAILAIEYYPNRKAGPTWLFEIASLSTDLIGAERDGSAQGGELKWTAKKPGLAFAPVEDAPPPSERAAQRLAQMKTLRARFTAYEHAVIEGRVELRPLASPLYRYADADRGLTDGAIFSFANGTNPEVLLVLEAQAAGAKGADVNEADAKPGWHYAIVQLTGGAIVVQHDGKDIFERGEADPPAVRDSYINGWIPAAAK